MKSRWITASVGGTLLILLFSAFVGFVWLPSAQEDNALKGILDRICGAAGIPRGWLQPGAPPVESTHKTSTVVFTADMARGRNVEGATGRGGTLALRCTMCHGIRGVSASDTPNLAGQEASSIYKELRDFQTGARTSAVMAPLVMNLSDQDLRDVSAFYASLPRGAVRDLASAPDIVAVGAPMRNIPPCGSCHGAMEAKIGVPWLDPQPKAYLQAQLEAFAHGRRQNDTSGQMRNIAKNMTEAEIKASVDYYAGGQ